MITRIACIFALMTGEYIVDVHGCLNYKGLNIKTKNINFALSYNNFANHTVSF